MPGLLTVVAVRAYVTMFKVPPAPAVVLNVVVANAPEAVLVPLVLSKVRVV